MRRLWSVGIRSTEDRIALGPEPAQGVGPEEDRSEAAVLREIAWSLAGWLGVVVVVQLLLRAFRIV
jgi:hypothetical protein